MFCAKKLFKGDMSIICIVLRAKEQEEIDLDLILFTFFKVRSCGSFDGHI